MKTKIEILDSCLGEHLKDIQPTVYGLILDAIMKYKEQENKELKETLRELSDAIHNYAKNYGLGGELDTALKQTEQLLKTKSE